MRIMDLVIEQKPSGFENYIEKQKSKQQLIKESQDAITALSPSAIKQAMKAELERVKAERLRHSYTYEEVAEEFGIYPRSFKEYVKGRRKPGKGVAATRYGRALEKYYLDDTFDRWFIRNDYTE
jgi:hypothetical protein